MLSGLETTIPISDIIVRLVAACLLGALIGVDREIRRHAAGLRTHMLVSLASAMFMLIAYEMIGEFAEGVQDAKLDPTRVIQAVTAGVAFLAAGAIIQSKGSVHGLTTGAGMWLSSAIGLACGAGYLTLALLGALFSMIVLIPFRFLEFWLPKKQKSGSEPDEEAG